MAYKLPDEITNELFFGFDHLDHALNEAVLEGDKTLQRTIDLVLNKITKIVNKYNRCPTCKKPIKIQTACQYECACSKPSS